MIEVSTEVWSVLLLEVMLVETLVKCCIKQITEILSQLTVDQINYYCQQSSSLMGKFTKRHRNNVLHRNKESNYWEQLSMGLLSFFTFFECEILMSLCFRLSCQVCFCGERLWKKKAVTSFEHKRTMFLFLTF